ncbi:MAG: 1,4-dihydroxy-2-naphthoate octaprenyltransferase [Cardiobacteriaceae bacterium]|nr:1,4-dihydroxy-2-naphthoate octaprenyltransferase [Cardiobacteriaceae bacterium]
MNPYLELIRPKTLPLAAAVITTGNALAWWHADASPLIYLLELITALSLQILSNIANDYGDGLRGTDTHRQGPRRMYQSGLIGARTLRLLILFFALFSLASGILVIVLSERSPSEGLTIFAFGVLAILAAIGYTVGRHAYGYYALGEVSVYLFFGLLGVVGSYALHHMPIPPAIYLPASGAGLLAAGVLHINNLRDLDSDAQAGRKTLAIHLGLARGKQLHLILLGAALLCYLLFALLHLKTAWASLLWLILLPAILAHGKRLLHASNSAQIGGELKTLVILNLAIALLFSAGLSIHKII